MSRVVRKWLVAAGLVSLLGALAMPVAAQGAAADASPTAPAAMDTGDVWMDAQLQDIDHYAARYRHAFVDELVRYHAVQRPAVYGWLARPGWRPGDVYLACAIANVQARPCSDVVALREQAGLSTPWTALLETVGATADSAHFRRVKRGVVDSYQRWARPLRPDAALRRQLAAEQRAKARSSGSTSGR